MSIDDLIKDEDAPALMTCNCPSCERMEVHEYIGRITGVTDSMAKDYGITPNQISLYNCMGCNSTRSYESLRLYNLGEKDE